MSLRIFDEIEQRTEEWYEQRRGMVTASVVGKLVTAKTIKVAANDESRGVCALLTAERVEQQWWQDYVEPFRDRPGEALHVEFLRGRMRFERPGWQPGPKGDRPPFGCALLIWEHR